MKRYVSRREFESDEEDASAAEEQLPAVKKRRLPADQVKALERSFEAENKLEPERKVQLALELGLDPRQVAIWFQNRRARWKTKQLERDYNSLQSEYDDLKLNYDTVKRENETLIKQIDEMKAKLVNRDVVVPENGRMVKEEMVGSGEFEPELNIESALYDYFKVVSSDSASSEVVSEDNSPLNVAVYSSMMLGNEAPEIWPESYSFLAEEEPAPMFNWYCPDPWN